MDPVSALPLVAVVTTGLATVWLVDRRGRGHPGDRATFHTLHTASLASGPLRLGLTQASAERAVRHLRSLLGAPALAITDTAGVLAWDGAGSHHRNQTMRLATPAIDGGATQVHRAADVSCDLLDCPLQAAVAVPIAVDDLIVGSLVVLAPTPSAALVRTATEVSRWVSNQLELAELDLSLIHISEPTRPY